MPRNLGRRLLFTALSALALVAGLIPTASAATLPPVLYAPTGFAHQCIEIGYDGDLNVGIICADIVTSNVSGGYHADPQVEAYCQNDKTGDIVQCANVTVDFGLFGSNSNSQAFFACGHAYGPCAPNGQRNYWGVGKGLGETYHETINQCSGNVSLETQVQTVVFSSSATFGQTTIELPSTDKTVQLTTGNDGANQASGHYFICPSS